MSTFYKNFDIPVGDEDKVSQEISAYYNRQGRIGNSVANMKLVVKNNGSITAIVSSEGKADDGRQIDDIEDRKTVQIIRVAPGSGDEEKVAAFTNTHNELGDIIARPFITAAGDDTVYLMIATKRVVNDWDGDNAYTPQNVNVDEPADIKAEDWMEESQPTAETKPVEEMIPEAAPVIPGIPAIPTPAPADNDTADELGDIFT